MTHFRMKQRHEFITIADITNMQEEMNYVIWNFQYPLEKRLSEFTRLMKKKFKHRFTKKELEKMSQFNSPATACDLINYLQRIIYKE